MYFLNHVTVGYEVMFFLSLYFCLLHNCFSIKKLYKTIVHESSEIMPADDQYFSYIK